MFGPLPAEYLPLFILMVGGLGWRINQEDWWLPPLQPFGKMLGLLSISFSIIIVVIFSVVYF